MHCIHARRTCNTARKDDVHLQLTWAVEPRIHQDQGDDMSFVRTPDHVPSGSAELRPHRPPDHVVMMIVAKNGATTIATTVMTTGQKARGQLHRQRHVKPSLEHRNTPTTPAGRQ